MRDEKYYFVDNNNNSSGTYTLEQLQKLQLPPNTPIYIKDVGICFYAKDINRQLRKKSSSRRKEMFNIALIIVFACWIIFFLFRYGIHH